MSNVDVPLIRHALNPHHPKMYIIHKSFLQLLHVVAHMNRAAHWWAFRRCAALLERRLAIGSLRLRPARTHPQPLAGPHSRTWRRRAHSPLHPERTHALRSDVAKPLLLLMHFFHSPLSFPNAHYTCKSKIRTIHMMCIFVQYTYSLLYTIPSSLCFALLCFAFAAGF